ncbi:MAG: addiction module protein [Planctomycetaceae bacterium]
MRPTLQELGIDQLSSAERLRLIGDIWDSLSPLTETEVPTSHLEELDHRLDDANASPETSRPWNEVRSKLWGEE